MLNIDRNDLEGPIREVESLRFSSAIYFCLSGRMPPDERARVLAQGLESGRRQIRELGAPPPGPKQIYCDVVNEPGSDGPRPERDRMARDVRAGKIAIAVVDQVADLGSETTEVVELLISILDYAIGLYTPRWGRLPLGPARSSGNPAEELRRSMKRVWALQEAGFADSVIIAVFDRRREQVPRSDVHTPDAERKAAASERAGAKPERVFERALEVEIELA